MSNYYNILEITKDASDEEVKKAYKKMAKKCHPDKNRDNQEDATSKFKQISEAYQVLSDAETRRMYDKNVEEKNPYSNNYGFSSEEDNIDNFFNDNSDKNTYKNFGFDTSETELDELLEYLDSTNHNYSTENYFFEDRKVNNKVHNKGIFEDDLNIFNSLNTEFGMMHNEEFEYKDGYCEYSRSTSRSNPEKQEKSKGDKINVLKNVQPASNTCSNNNVHFDSMVTPGNLDKSHRDSEDNGEIIIEDEDECEKDYVKIIKDDNDESEVEKIDEDIVFVDKYQSESKKIYEKIVIEDDYKSDSKQNYEDTYNEDVNIVENIDIDIDFPIQNRYGQNSSPRTTYNGNKISSNICSICSKLFHYKSQLNHHMKVHGSYGAKYTTNLYHHDKLTKLQCSKCRMPFLDETGLKRHLVSHKENIQFKCDDCGKAFIQMENLKIHKQCHVRGTNLVCPEWNEMSISKKAMKDHLSAQSADKPGKMTNCYKCGKMFAEGIALIKHAMSHA